MTMHGMAGRTVAMAGIAAALVMVVWVSPGYAPQRDKPETLSIDAVTWNSQAQVFLVEHSALFGIAQAGESAESTLHTLLLVADAAGTQIALLGPQVSPVISREGTTGDDERSVRLVPQLVPWDRDGGSFVGTATVMVMTDVRNPAGETVATATDVRMLEIQ